MLVAIAVHYGVRRRFVLVQTSNSFTITGTTSPSILYDVSLLQRLRLLVPASIVRADAHDAVIAEEVH